MVGLEIMASIIPLWFSSNSRLRFDILVIVYISLRFDNPFLPFLILLIELLDIAFSTEHFALGTFAGMFIFILIRQLKGLLRVETKTLIAALTTVCQLVWFIVVSVFIYLRSAALSTIGYRFLYFISEAIFLSLISPYIFMLFDKIMRIDSNFELGE
jgi:hypothetical protein